MVKSAEIFRAPHYSRDERQKYKIELFARQSVSGITTIINMLENTPLRIDPDVLEGAVSQWSTDETHGIEHSYFVYEVMQEIREKEGIDPLQVTDDDLFIRAVLHDLAEFLPITKNDGSIIPQNLRSRKHPKYMQILINSIGQTIKLEDPEQLALDILYHDIFYSQPTKETMDRLRNKISLAGQILADADKLVFPSPEAIERNRAGSIGKWYFFRQDLNNRQRKKWWSRTKGLFDGLSPLLREFCSPDYCLYTKFGQKENREKSGRFVTDIDAYIRNWYSGGWRDLNDAQQKGWKIEFGLKDGNEIIEIPIDQRNQFNFDNLSLAEKIVTIVDILVIDRKTGARNYYGYSIRITKDTGEYKWLDPSLLIYEDEEELVSILNATIYNYQTLGTTPIPSSPEV